MTSNGSKPDDPLDQVDEAIGKLEGTQWDEDSQVTHVHAAPGSVVNVDNTGKFAAVEPPTNPINPRPASDPPSGKAGVAISILKLLPPWGRVVVLLAVLALVAWRGGVGLGWWR
jgi:hypothetical protein